MSGASLSAQPTGTGAGSKGKARSARRGVTGVVRGRGRIGANPMDISNVGWSNLEEKFHELMDLMDSPTSGINAMEARNQHRQKVKEVIGALLDKAQDECRNLLIQGNGEAAEEAGVKVLKLRESFYGSKHLQLLPSYLHLARAKQFMERYGDAEEMLSLASYIAQKNQTSEELTVSNKAELHQTYGLLYAADEKLEVAVKHLTYATYYMSCLHGPQHILTTFSYFDLGNVFAAKACMENAMAMYDNVKEIWYNHLRTTLTEVLAERSEAAKLQRYAEEDDHAETEGYASARAFGTDNLIDTSKMLHGIYAIQKERYRVDHPSTARAQFILGLFLLWVSDDSEAAAHLTEAHASLQKFYGPRHSVVAEVEEWCTKFGFTVENGTEEAPGAADGTVATPARKPSQKESEPVVEQPVAASRAEGEEGATADQAS